MKKIITLLILMFTVPLFAQGDRGVFSSEYHIVGTGSTALTDTTMIDSVSFNYPTWPTMTIYYRFIDSGSVSTTLYVESQIKGRLTNTQWPIIDSLVVSLASDTFKVWNITDAAVGVADRWRLRKSTADDTLIAIFRGFAEVQP